ncbi:MAG: ComEC/Rec2 family competence protein [Minisyncoccia bacterium]
MTFGGRKHHLSICVILLILGNIFLFRLEWKSSQKLLTFVMLDVGQGDALFIESPTGTQIIFDAGPPRKILSALSWVISPFDKNIDAIVITNPDADHIGGFAEILKNYKVGYVFEPGTINDSKTFQNLKSEIKKKKIPDILARKGMRLHLGGGAVIDILFPDRDVREWATNEGSVVARLSYGSTSVLLTGDSTSKTEKIILEENSSLLLKSDVLKVGHHGSRSSTSLPFVKLIAPQYALVSAGADNSYGHPHPETSKTLLNLGVKVLRTDLVGTIIMKSDGQKETFSFRR